MQTFQGSTGELETFHRNEKEVTELSLAENTAVSKNINGFKQDIVKIHGKTC